MKLLLRSILPVIAASAFLSTAHAATITATADNFIRSSTPSTGNSTNGLVLLGNVNATDSIRGLVEFSMGGVAGQTSTGSSVVFTITDKDGSTTVSKTVTLSLYLVTATGVDVNAATWNNKAAGTAWSAGGGVVGVDYGSTALATLQLDPSKAASYDTLSFSSAALDSALTNAAATGGSLIFALISSTEGTTDREVIRIGASEKSYGINPRPEGPQVNFVPEPSAALMGCAGVALLVLRRRK